MIATALPDGTELARWRRPDEHQRGAEAIAFDSSGRFFVVARAGEPAVELRTWPDGGVQRVFSGLFPQALCAVAVAVADGAMRIAGGDKAGRVTVWAGTGHV